jgi:RimJ/RimL family protein N-acetyltransferase
MACDQLDDYAGRASVNLIYGHSEQVAAWVAEHIPDVGAEGFSSPVAAIGVATDHLVAGVCYHDYQPKFGTIQLSMAAISPIWARRPIIHALLAYPFEQLQCFKVWTATALDNVKAIKVNEHVGFKREAILAHQFGQNRHAVIMRLLRPDYLRLYGELNGQV